jgi:hypothetical protein
MAVCSERLAPEGVALISYNTPPGRSIRQMLRDMLRYHLRDTAAPAARVTEARRFLEFYRQARTLPDEWCTVVESEIQTMLERGDGGLYHDDLASVNDPVYFHEFAAHAASHGLQYVGEAQPHEMIDQNGSLGWTGDDVLAREQYLDFLKARRFRQTLLCRESVYLDRAPASDRMDRFLFSASGRGVEVRAADEAVHRVTSALDDLYPLPAAFEELIPYAGDATALREITFTLVRGGFANLHVYEFPCADSVTERPGASALARIQAEWGSEVSNLCQQTVELDELAHALLPWLDGTRTVAEAAGLAGVNAEEAALSVEWMAAVALLVK